VEETSFSARVLKLQHARHYAHVLADLSEQYDAGGEAQVAVLADFEQEQRQIDIAWDRLIAGAPDDESDLLLLDYGRAAVAIGDLRYDKQHRRRQQYTAMLTAAQRRGQLRDEAVALMALASDADDLSVFTEALTLSKQAHTIAHALSDLDMQASILVNEGCIYAHQGAYHQAITYYEKAIALRPNAADGNYHALGSLALSYDMLGQHDSAQIFYDQALVLARHHRDLRAEGNLLGDLGLLMYAQGNLHQSCNLHQQALAISRALGDRAAEEKDLLHQGIALQELGEVDEAMRCFQEAASIAVVIGDQRGLAYALGSEGRLLVDIGDESGARVAFDRAISVAEAVGDQKVLGLALLGSAILWLAQDDAEVAFRQCDRALAALRSCGPLPELLNGLSGITNAAFKYGETERAYSFATEWYHLALTYGNLRAQSEALIALGGTAHSTGRLRRAYRHYSQARRLLYQLNDHALWGLLQWNRGLLLAAMGNYKHALSSFRDSVASAQAVGDPNAEQREAYLQTLNGRVWCELRRWRRKARAGL
jgi:tetratricopeptide (TPR) repeat protein